jgi:glucose dehydrogenase
MRDYDSAQTPVLVDGMFNGKARKMILSAARNGYCFVVDRVTGEHLLTSKYGSLTNWAAGLNQFGGPKRKCREGRHCRRLLSLTHPLPAELLTGSLPPILFGSVCYM